MRVVIDAIPVMPVGGNAVALVELLRGWDKLRTDDEIHLLLDDEIELEVPRWVHVHSLRIGRPHLIRRIIVQSRAARRICRAVDADALLAVMPTTAIVPVGCPKVVTIHDLRHEVLPEQFSRGRRLLRKLSYGIGYRQAAGVMCDSERTRRDLLHARPWLRSKPVLVVPLGADHVDDWPQSRRSNGDLYALAFGHFPNKAVQRVMDAWTILHERGEAKPLVLVGLSNTRRDVIGQRIQAAGLDGIVTPLPWLDDGEFHMCFASAGLIVFPSDFEGFGLPAIEAMRLGIPLVISKDKALLEVTGGNATVAADDDPMSLAEAISAAWITPEEELDQAQAYVNRYRWEKTAASTREILARVTLISTTSAVNMSDRHLDQHM